MERAQRRAVTIHATALGRGWSPQPNPHAGAQGPRRTILVEPGPKSALESSETLDSMTMPQDRQVLGVRAPNPAWTAT